MDFWIWHVRPSTCSTKLTGYVQPYPKDDEPRTLAVSQELLDLIAQRIGSLGLSRDDLLFTSTETSGGRPLS